MYTKIKDPEIMAEAKKMRENPEFQAQMKKFADSGAFKEGVKKTKEIMDDPNKSAKLQAQMEHVSNKKVIHVKPSFVPYTYTVP